MRDICLVTFYRNNYGSMLQSYALTRALSERGYHVCMFKRFRARLPLLKHPILFYARIANRLQGKKRREFFSPVPYEMNESRKKRQDSFIDSFFDEVCFDTNDQWADAVAKNTIFVAGSDIIWQPNLGYPSKYFLDFAVCDELPCFSYASSIGALELPKKYHRAYRRYLGAFECIGVRETSSVKLLEPIVGRPVTKVVDPTLLLCSEQWDELARQAQVSVDVDPGGYVFCYFVMDDQRYWDYICIVQEQTGLQVVVLPMHYRDEEQPYSVVLDGTPYEYVWLIKNAEFVLTDSFHACVFSLIYEKEFYLMRRTRKSEDAKYDDFLGRYGLADRVVKDETSFERTPKVDYSLAKEQLAKDRSDSYAFLDNALEGL